MSRELERRLAKLERPDQSATVRQISDIMDELSAKAAGDHEKPRQESGLLDLLGDDQ